MTDQKLTPEQEAVREWTGEDTTSIAKLRDVLWDKHPNSHGGMIGSPTEVVLTAIDHITALTREVERLRERIETWIQKYAGTRLDLGAQEALAALLTPTPKEEETNG
jgi:hypothetical protein